MPEPVETPYLRAGLLTAVLAAVLAVLSASLLTAISAASEASLLGSLRSGVRAWLVPMGSGLEVGGTSLSLVPLGGTVLVGLAVLLASRWVVSEPVDEIAAYAATVAGASGALAALLSTLTDTAQVETSTVRSAFGAFVVTGVAAALAVGPARGRAADLWPTEDVRVRAVVRAAGHGVAALLASCAVLLVVLLGLSLDRAGDLWAALDPGTGGAVVLGLLCLVAVPTLVLWTVAVVLGPGIALGEDTSLDLTGSYLGQVPGLPVLAALPEPGAFGDWVVVLGLLPVLAGVAAGWRLTLPEGTALLHRVGLGAAAGGLAGLAVGVLVVLSSGSIGPGRMAEAGPAGLTALLVAVPVLAAGGGVGAALAHYRGVRAQQPSDREARRPRLRLRDEPAGADRRDSESEPGPDTGGILGLLVGLRRERRRGRGRS